MRQFANAIPTTNELVLDAGKPLPGCIPILPIRDAVLFPFSMVPLTVGRSGSLKLLEDLRRCSSDRLIGVLSQRDASKDDPGADELFSVGTLAVVIKELRLKDETRILFVQGLKRFRITRFQQLRPYPKAEVEYLSDLLPSPEIAKDTAAARRRIETLFEKLVSLQPNLSEDLVTIILNIEELSLMADFIASILPSESVAAKQDLLETLDVSTRLQKIQAELIRMIEIFEIKDKIQSETQNELGKSQREYYLREQLKAIQKELGETNGSAKDLEALQKAIHEAGLSEEAQKEATVELKRLVYISPASPEYAVIKTYLDWLVSLPWRKFSDIQIDIGYAAQYPRSRPPRTGKNQEAHFGVSRRHEAQTQWQSSHSLLCWPARCWQDLFGKVHRRRARAKIHPALAGWHAGRGRNPRPSPDLYRFIARSDHSRHSTRGRAESGVHAG